MNREDAIFNMAYMARVSAEEEGDTLVNKIYDDFESMTCENCALKIECNATLGLNRLYPNHLYIKEIINGSCMNFERKT